MFYVYLLKSQKDDNYYIGQTNNIKNRFKQHNNGQVKSTKQRRPLVLLGYETYETRSESMWREHQLKKHSDRKEQFIKSILDQNDN